MFPITSRLRTHLLILAVVGGLLFFLKLGAPSLWDIDEGNNAEASREMLESDNWVVPTFNYELRVDKPALLYWLQMAAYKLHGIDEFAARLPSALAAFAGVFVAYALGRRMFGPMEGLLAGLILASSLAFCASAHFANPDALLNLCTIATLTFFWFDYCKGARTWFWTAGITAGFGVLAKGPVGVVLPGTVVILFLLVERKLGILRDWRLVGVLCLALVACAWYALVGVETKAEFLIGFLLKHNIGRFREPMEKHGGSIFYYVAVVLVGFGSWSVFLLSTFWYGTGNRARERGMTLAANRFLWCWIGTYLLFFSVASTKLPNYILPLYAPLALLMARFLERWRTGEFAVVWPVRISLICLVLVGIGTAVTMLLVGGALPGDPLRGQYLPGFRKWAALGCLPVIAGVACWWCQIANRPGLFLTSMATMAVLFTCGLIVCASKTLDEQKAPRFLSEEGGACQPDEEVRTGAFGYFQPSLVFYCRREVTRLDTEAQAATFLQSPLKSFLFVPENVWNAIQPKMPAACHVIMSHYELYRRCRVVVVANQ